MDFVRRTLRMSFTPSLGSTGFANVRVTKQEKFAARAISHKCRRARRRPVRRFSVWDIWWVTFGVAELNVPW
jgi:hypothetical protein